MDLIRVVTFSPFTRFNDLVHTDLQIISFLYLRHFQEFSRNFHGFRASLDYGWNTTAWVAAVMIMAVFAVTFLSVFTHLFTSSLVGQLNIWKYRRCKVFLKKEKKKGFFLERQLCVGAFPDVVVGIPVGYGSKIVGIAGCICGDPVSIHVYLSPNMSVSSTSEVTGSMLISGR